MSETDETSEPTQADRIQEIQDQIKDALLKHGGEHLLDLETPEQPQEQDAREQRSQKLNELYRPVRQLEVEDLKTLKDGDVVWYRHFEFGRIRNDGAVFVLSNNLADDGDLELGLDRTPEGNLGCIHGSHWTPELGCFSAEGHEVLIFSVQKVDSQQDD